MARISKGTRQKNIASTLNVPMLNVLAMEGLLLRRFCDSKPRFQGRLALRLALLRTGTHGHLRTFVTICASDLRASPWESGKITPRDYARTFCSPECTKASPKADRIQAPTAKGRFIQSGGWDLLDNLKNEL